MSDNRGVAAALTFSGVLVLYAVIAQLAAARGTGSRQDYLLGGRASNRLVIALSAGAASTSGFVMIGAVGAGYNMGVTAVFMPLAWFAGDLLFWNLFPSRIHRLAGDTGCSTIPSLLEVTVRDASIVSVRRLSAFLIVVFVGLYAAGQLLAAGKTVNALFDIPLHWGIAAAGAVILVFCARGGLRASIWTNALQAVLMLLTTVGMLIAGVIACDGPGAALDGLLNNHPELLDPLSATGNAWLLGLFLLGFAAAAFGFDLSTPQFLVRVMAGRNEREVAAAQWYYLAFMQITWITMALFGMLARLIFPEIADPEQALPHFAVTLLPPWLTGLVIAGIFSAISSTLEGQLLVISSSLAIDFSPATYGRLAERIGTRLDALVTIGVGLVLILVTVNVSGTVFDLIVFSATALSAAFAPVMLIVLLRAPATPASLKAAMISGIAMAIAWRTAGMHVLMIETLPGLLAGLAGNSVTVYLFPDKSGPVESAAAGNK